MTVSQIETAAVQEREGLNAFLVAREFLFKHREDYGTAYRDFRWPQLNQFNWALDYFDAYALGNNKPALWIVDENGPEAKLSFAEMSRRSNQVANFLRQQGGSTGRPHYRPTPQRGRDLGNHARGAQAGCHHDPRSYAAYARRFARPARSRQGAACDHSAQPN